MLSRSRVNKCWLAKEQITTNPSIFIKWMSMWGFKPLSSGHSCLSGWWKDRGWCEYAEWLDWDSMPRVSPSWEQTFHLLLLHWWQLFCFLKLGGTVFKANAGKVTSCFSLSLKKKIVFIYLAALGLCCWAQPLSSCDEWGLLSSCSEWLSHWSGFFCHGACTLVHARFSSHTA